MKPVIALFSAVMQPPYFKLPGVRQVLQLSLAINIQCETFFVRSVTVREPRSSEMSYKVNDVSALSLSLSLAPVRLIKQESHS